MCQKNTHWLRDSSCVFGERKGHKGTEAGVQGLLLLLLFVLRIRCKCSKMLASAVSWAGYEVLVLFLFVFCCKVAILQNWEEKKKKNSTKPQPYFTCVYMHSTWEGRTFLGRTSLSSQWVLAMWFSLLHKWTPKGASTHSSQLSYVLLISRLIEMDPISFIQMRGKNENTGSWLPQPPQQLREASVPGFQAPPTSSCQLLLYLEGSPT